MTLRDDLAEVGLHCTIDGAVATMTLHRPEVRNAQKPSMWAGMVDFVTGLGDDVRVVVVRGSGGIFSAGLDLGLIDPARTEEPGNLIATMRMSDAEVVDAIDGYQQAFTALMDPRFISVAAVDGAAIGAGFQLALACDLRVATDRSYFCMKEPALGLVPDLTGTKPLVEAVGYARALEICATARKVDAEEAGQIGLVQELVGADELDATVETLVAALTAHDADAVRATTVLLREAGGRSLEEQRLAERTAQVARLRALVG
ncbi:enoyl-CoA hydratase/isomerase family protein [Nocardioides sambongensis]|uniref:enoyl-CoA hydratase/isomerase family protein n=1 Tax=Nocardioides sambongensis TaxID=2589074 RepID=UPI001E59A2F0|nr:enoyl-CoA hydratase/isomerase family protein [Nocardioides sambongensis]